MKIFYFDLELFRLSNKCSEMKQIDA